MSVYSIFSNVVTLSCFVVFCHLELSFGSAALYYEENTSVWRKGSDHTCVYIIANQFETDLIV